MRRGEHLVELPDGSDIVQPVESESSWMAPLFAEHTVPKGPDKIPLIEHVRPPLERARALGDFQDGRYGADAPQGRRGLIPVLARQLERQIPPQ